MRVSAIIATKDRPDDLGQTLASVASCRPLPDELIVVDGDPARSAARVVEAARGGPLELLYLPSQPGLTRQRNVGVRSAKGDVVVFLDDDVEADAGLFAALARPYHDPAVVGATGLVVEADERRFGNRRSLMRRLLLPGQEGTLTRFGYPRRLRQLDHEVDVEVMQGCLMSGRRDTVERIGFDESLPGYALAEDEDFSYRLSRVGRIRCVPDARVVHKNTGFRSSGTREFNRTVVLNRAYLFRKNFRQTLTARLGFGGLVVILIAHRAVNREWEGVRGLLEGARDAWRTDGRHRFP